MATSIKLPETDDVMLSIKIQEYGIAAESYWSCLEEVWRTKDDIEFYRNNMLTSLEDVLNYVYEHYERKVKPNGTQS